MRSVIQALIASFQFLSRLPIPISIQYTKEVFSRSVVFYPLVGSILGGLIWLFGYGAQLGLPLVVCAALTLAFTVMLTGALHLDGLMDTADGILSHRPREQMLEIMKDSRVGAMGVIVCVLVMLIKGSMLFTLLEQRWTWALPLPFIWSRWFMVLAIVRWPYARKESGLGSYFKGVGARGLAGATCTAILVSLAVMWLGTASGNGLQFADVSKVLWIGGSALFFGWCMAAYMSRKLGGLTGDTYGALNELLEVILLLVLIVC